MSGGFFDATRYRDRADYMAQNEPYRPSSSMPDLQWQARLERGWRTFCRESGRAGEAEPATSTTETPETAAAWRKRALEQAHRAKTSSNLPESVEELTVGALALMGRGPDGRKLL